MDQRYQGFAGTAGRLVRAAAREVSGPCIKGGRRAKQAAQGRLAQLVRASRLHREGRQFESVAAYQPSRQGCHICSARRAKAVAPKLEERRRTVPDPPNKTIKNEDRAMDAPTGHDQNADQIAYWNGPAGQRWAQRQAAQDIVLGPVADLVIDRAKLKPGERVIDVGCGSGATAGAFAREVAPSGHGLGGDISGPRLGRGRQGGAKG